MYIYRCVYMSLVKIMGTNGFLVHLQRVRASSLAVDWMLRSTTTILSIHDNARMQL
jgi:hypothetical protein